MISDPQTIRLPASTSVRECALLKQQLLVLVECTDAVLIDVTDVELIDTAVLQLLFAFDRERTASALRTIWQGESSAFRSAAAAVGVQVGDSAGPQSNGAH